jgi:pyridoxal phosphate enzyme (YggS family)
MPFPDLPARVREVREHIDAAIQRGGHDQQVAIIAVTKTHGPEAPVAAWDVGIRDVGENRVQEAVSKMDAVAVPVRWHLIGHLQRNKARHVKRFHLVHSLDNPRLASILDDLGRQESHVVDALVQVNVVGEETKGGYDLASLPSEAERLRTLTNVRIRGVMTMAPLDADERTLRTVFSGARRARQLLREAGCADATELSMGMSNDYEIAVEEGATFVRLGTILFGARSA